MAAGADMVACLAVVVMEAAGTVEAVRAAAMHPSGMAATAFAAAEES